jgi:hypothetical protein
VPNRDAGETGICHCRQVSDFFKAVAALCGAIIAVVGLFAVLNTTPKGSSAPSGQVVEPGTCLQGFVWRVAYPGDKICVTNDERSRVAADNAAAPSRVDPNGAYGPDTCVQGFIWRGAIPSDHVCVTREEYDRVRADNDAGPARVQQ